VPEVTMKSFAAVAAVALAVPLLAGPPPAFDEHFLDGTLRIDTFHTGNATEEVVSLDYVYRQGIWPGSRTHLIDPFSTGNYLAKVFDAASGVLLFSKGYDTYFGEYRTTAPAANGVRRTYHESVLIPCPKGKVRFSIEARGRDGSLKEIFSAQIDPAAVTVIRRPLEAGVSVVDALKSGDPHSKVDIAILAEGYTALQETKFRVDLARFVKLFLAQEPYATRKDSFNIYGVFKASQESGCDEPSWGSFKNTALNASFDSLGSERYMLIEDNRRLRDLAAHVPYDAILVMVNSSRYGGGGIYNLYSTFTTDNYWSTYVFLHEFGHSFAGLADEYYTSSVAYTEFFAKGVEPSPPNVTALLDPAHLKWAALVTPGTAIPTPWEKADFDAMDIAYQKVREELNGKIAAAKRAGAPRPEVEKLEDESDRLSREHASKIDAYLAKSAFAGKVGAFEGASYVSQGLYRPMVDCLMFSKGAKPFCKVCQQAVVRVIEYYGE
jgi:IgA Peptidase M64/Peptidase M64 N-terminus